MRDRIDERPDMRDRIDERPGDERPDFEYLNCKERFFLEKQCY